MCTLLLGGVFLIKGRIKLLYFSGVINVLTYATRREPQRIEFRGRN